MLIQFRKKIMWSGRMLSGFSLVRLIIPMTYARLYGMGHIVSSPSFHAKLYFMRMEVA